MRCCAFLLFLVSLSLDCVKRRESCVSTVSITECEGVTFSRGQPFRLGAYRSFVQFKKGGRLQEIPAGSFSLLPDVTTLYLSFNTIKSVEAGSFSGLTKLAKLILNHNELANIPNGVFRDCRRLIFLDLGANKIRTVENKALDELVDLEEIILSFNQLDGVPGAVRALGKLKKLDLSGNGIERIDEGAFEGLNELLILNLESNKIRHISDNAFRGLGKTTEINLKDNYLVDLNAANLINNLQSLKTIKLSVNDFACNTLRTIIQLLESKNIYVAKGVSKAQVTVNGISCK